MDPKDLIKGGFLNLIDVQREPSPPANAERIGRYLILELLGRGGMSKVYRAHDQLLNREVALKQVRMDEAAMSARFTREVGLLAKLSHPGIIPIFDFGRSGDTAYFTMPVVNGSSMEEVITGGLIDPKEAARIVQSVAVAMEHAHGQGILHRDLKPSNILIDKTGRVLVMDFGLGRLEDPAERDSNRMTATGAFMGTPYYVSPEQAKGDWKNVDPTSDIYSLGVTLYEALAGRPPFEGKTAVEVIQRILHDDPSPLRKLRTDVPRDLEVICHRAMEKERSRRYPSMKEFADDLGRYLNDEPIRANPQGLGYRARKKATRHKALLVALLAVGVVGAGVVSYQSMRFSRKLKDELHIATRLEGGGKLKEARDAFIAILAQSAGDPEATAGLTRVDVRLGEARNLVETAGAKLASASQYLYSAGFEVKNLRAMAEEARTLLEQAIAIEPDLAMAHSQLGYAFEFLGWEDRAEKSYRKAIEHDAKLSAPRLRLGRLLGARAYLLSISGPTREEREMAKAEYVHLAASACRELDEAARLGNANASGEEAARILLEIVKGDERFRIPGRCTEAITKLGRKPGVEDFYWLRAIAQTSPDAKIADFSEALSIYPHFHNALLGRGLAYAEKGDRELAEKDFAAAVEIKPQSYLGHYSLGRQRITDGRYQAAADSFSAAIEINPRFAAAYSNRGEARQRLNDLDGAFSDYEQCISLIPELAEPYNNRGTVRQRRGQLDEALADFTLAIQHDPDHYVAYTNRGNIHAHKKRPEMAVEDYGRAIRINKAYVEAWCGRGLAHLLLNQVDPAIADLDEAIRLNPAYGLSYFNRGKAFDVKGDAKAALADFEKFLTLAPQGQARSEAEQRVRRAR